MSILNFSPASQNTPRVFVVCDQDATAPIWGYIIRDKGLIAILETSVQRAMERSVEEIPDLIVIDVNVQHSQRIELCRKFRSLSSSPILLFLPTNNEPEILEAYQNGVDECVVKPISPAIFLAKIIAWSLLHDVTSAQLPGNLGITGLLTNSGTPKPGLQVFKDLFSK